MNEFGSFARGVGPCAPANSTTSAPDENLCARSRWSLARLLHLQDEAHGDDSRQQGKRHGDSTVETGVSDLDRESACSVARLGSPRLT